jgi:hypothetical protein
MDDVGNASPIHYHSR